MTTNEHTHDVNGVRLSAQTMGDRSDPALLLLHGAGHSLAAWPDEFVQRLADQGRFVIRYDSRDAGQSTGYAPGAPPYTLRDLVADAVGVLDSYGLTSAHIIGMSQGAAVAQLVALDHPSRVKSLSLASSTPGGPGHENADLPTPLPEIEKLFAAEEAEPDWTDRDSIIEYLIEAERPFAAASRTFDRAHALATATRLVDRAADIASQLTNPYLIDAGDPWRARLSELTVPTLVLHGTEDPLFPIEHGQALAREIPDAQLLALQQTGHEVFPPTQWDTVIPTITKHTASP